MKIVVTGTRGFPDILGGVETHCEELFPRIAAKGLDVVVIRRKSYVRDSMKSYKGVTLYDIPNFKNKPFESIIHTFCAIWLAKTKFHADIVHIHAIGPALLTRLARLFKLKVVFTHHGPDYDRDKWGKIAKFMLRLGERTGCHANKVIVISNVINDIIKKKYGRKDAYLIPNGVNPAIIVNDSEYLSGLSIEPGKYVLTMGRFVPEKNFHILIDAFCKLNQSEYKLVIAGDIEIEDKYSLELKTKAKENNVILAGFIKGRKLQTLLSNARLFVLPSSHEGLPISLLEAMSYRLPVLASDIPANKDINLPSPCYFHSKGNIVENLCEALKNRLNDNSEISYDLSLYDWDNIAERTVNVYSTVMDQK